MSEHDGLATWAGRSVPLEPEDAPPAPPKGGGGPVKVVAAVAGLLAVGAIGVVALGGSEDGTTGEEVAAVETTTTTAAPGALPFVEEASTTTTTAAPPPEPPPGEAPTTAPPVTETTVAPTTETTVAPSTTVAPPAVDPGRKAVFRGGKVYLQGRIASRAEADEIVTKAGAVVGPDNVVDEYVVDPSVPYIDAAPLYVEDRVLFAFGSAAVEPDFVPLLDLGMVLLQQNPGVTITVVGHTDSSGSVEFNQRLSEQRVASVIRYFTDRGIDPGRFIGDARGKSDPLVPTPDGQREARNRRVEFIIAGLLDG